MTANGSAPGQRQLIVAAVVLVVSGLVAATDRLLVGEAGLVEALNGNPVLDTFPIEPFLISIMILGTLIGVGVVAIGAAVFLEPWQAPVGIVLAGAIAWAGAHVGKSVVGRGRPLELLDPRTLDISGSYATLTGAGYPSGHTAVAFALATALAPWLAPRHRWLPWAAATLVGVARLYVAAHFPLDVIGGAALGMVAGGLALLAFPPPAPTATAGEPAEH